MKILVMEDINLNAIANANIVLEVDEDKKGFTVIKHRHLGITDDHRHMSELKHILLSGESDAYKF